MVLGPWPVLLPPRGASGLPFLSLPGILFPSVMSSTPRVSLGQRRHPSEEASGPLTQATGSGSTLAGDAQKSPAAQAAWGEALNWHLSKRESRKRPRVLPARLLGWGSGWVSAKPFAAAQQTGKRREG